MSTDDVGAGATLRDWRQGLRRCVMQFAALRRGDKRVALTTAERRILQQAAREGVRDARSMLAMVYLFGAKRRSPSQARSLLRSTRPDATACTLEGLALDAGLFDGVRNPAGAATAFRRAYLAGDSVGRSRLALKYHWGDGVRKNPRAAVRLWTEGANEGDSMSIYHLAMALMEGVGVAKDPIRALKLMRMAAAAGSPQALCALADWQWFGDRARRNRVAAVRAYLVIARRPPGWPAYVASRLGLAHELGIGVERSERLAQLWYRRAAAMGEPEAWNDVGYMYLNGTCTAANPTRALRWFRKAFDAGSRAGAFNLAEAYSVLGRAQRAMHFYRLAAQSGHPKAAEIVQRQGTRQPDRTRRQVGER